MDFENKKALVTGAAGGIGATVTRMLLNSGAKVAAADLDLTDCEAHVCLPGNLTDSEYTNNLPKTAADSLGGLDILVNNAGIIRRGAVTAASDEDFDMSIAVNVKAPFQLCRAAIPIMAAGGGGAIVNIASCWGVHPGPDHAVYCMSKSGIVSLTQCMGRDHAHQGIRVNAVCPNEVDTPMLRTGFEIRGLDPATALSELDKSVPLGRVAQPNDIAEVVLFLASDRARYICGALVEVNGGKSVA